MEPIVDATEVSPTIEDELDLPIPADKGQLATEVVVATKPD